jgi:hypothetical protein
MKLSGGVRRRVSSRCDPDQWQKARLRNPPPLRNKAAEAFTAVVLGLAALFISYWYFPSQIFVSERDDFESTGSIPSPQLSAETAKQLVDQSLEKRPVLARVPLGDVVTVSTANDAITIYSELADAQLIRLRFCHFPGANGPGREVCVADLTEKGKQLAKAATPSMVIPLGQDTPAANRTYAQFIVGLPQVTEVDSFAPEAQGQAGVWYHARVEPTALAGVVIRHEQLPSKASGRATLRRLGPAWQVEQNEIEPYAAELRPN